MDGHCPGLSGRDLNAYMAAGIGSDHECAAFEEAAEKLARGMAVMIREGSQSKDLAKLIGIVNDSTWPRCMFVSDDLHPDDLIGKGHMNAIVNAAMTLGMDPVRAITLASWTPANYFRLRRRGALAPGFIADFSISPTIDPWNPVRVFKSGIEIAREGELLTDPACWPMPPLPGSPMRIGRISPEQLLVPAQTGKLRVIGILEATLFTRKLLMEPKIENGYVVCDPERDLLKAAVYNRYVPGRAPAVGFVHGLGLKKGAIATSVAHDSHNLIAAGVSDADISAAVSALRQTGGGLAAASGGRVEILPLPIAGLMSALPASDVSRQAQGAQSACKRLGGKTRQSIYGPLFFVASGHTGIKTDRPGDCRGLRAFLTFLCSSKSDPVNGKTWTLPMKRRPRAKRQEDLADILRIVETFPKVVKYIPLFLREQLNSV